MTKLEIIKWIESLENQAQQSNKFFIERNELYIEKQSLIKYIEDKIKKVRESTCDSKTIELLEKEVNSFKQALNEIRNLCISNMVSWDCEGDVGTDCCVDGFEVLKIIDKVLGESL